MVLHLYKCFAPPNMGPKLTTATKQTEIELTDTGNTAQFLTVDANNKSPIIDLVDFDMDELQGYNYAYIPKFKRYYSMAIEYLTSGIARLHLTTDLLTTAYYSEVDGTKFFKLQNNAYINRTSTNGYYNLYNKDEEYYQRLAYNTPRVYKWLTSVPDDTAYYIQCTGGDNGA